MPAVALHNHHKTERQPGLHNHRQADSRQVAGLGCWTTGRATEATTFSFSIASSHSNSTKSSSPINGGKPSLSRANGYGMPGEFCCSVVAFPHAGTQFQPAGGGVRGPGPPCPPGIRCICCPSSCAAPVPVWPWPAVSRFSRGGRIMSSRGPGQHQQDHLRQLQRGDQDPD